MGAVKIDVDRDNIEWYPVNLSDPSSVKGLIKYKTTFYLLHNRRNDSITISESFQDLNELPEEVICLYVWLDECVNKCGLTDKQLEILEKYMDDDTEEEIAKDLNVAPSTINGVINSCCKKISNYANEKWKNEYILWNKKKVTTNYKKCSKCKEFLPTTDEYFRKRLDTKDKLMYICRKCE